MANVLVTGAAGFIGSHVCDALLARGDSVVGVDNFNSFYDPRLKEENAAALATSPRFELVRGTLLDPELRRGLFAREPYDAVIHLAAWAGVRPSIEQPALYQRENIEASVGLMDEVRALPRPPRLVLASSSSVYGANKKVPFSETDPVERPVSPYAATKRSVELLSFTYHHLFGLSVANLRFFTVYGPRQRPEMAIHKFAALMRAGRPIPMFGDGSTARDYTFIDDIVRGVLAATDRIDGYRIYNLGNSDTVPLHALIEKLGAALGCTPQIEQLPEQPGDVPLTFADISLARAELDYQPRVSIDEGLRLFAEWFNGREPR